MKALKEKRISLRSLWRMGLVVLSVLALAFVACGDSDSGDSTSPPSGGSAPIGTKVPLSVSIDKYPFAGVNQDVVHEGQRVDLTGIEYTVFYSDNTSRKFTDPTKLTLEPSIYDYRLSGQTYQMTYSENGRFAQWLSVPTNRLMGEIRRIVDIDFTGRMVKQEYIIDDIPEFAGLALEAAYSRTNQVGPYQGWDNNNAGTQPDWYHLPLDFDPLNPDHNWAWIWNMSTGMGSYQPSDDPGVLISIGSFGWIDFERVAPKGTPGDVIEGFDWQLMGKRIPVTKLYQVKKLEWDTAPDYSKYPVFYDDPSLIKMMGWNRDPTARVEDIGDIGAPQLRYFPTYDVDTAQYSKWTDTVFAGAKFKITYGDSERDVTTRTKTILELREQGEIPGFWRTFSYWPITRQGNYIMDVDTYPIDDGVTGPAALRGGGYYETGTTNPRDPSELPGGKGRGYGEPAAQDGEGGWAEWAELANPRVRFTYRGINLDEPVPVYNRPVSIAVTARNGQTPVMMDGYDYVYRRPEGMPEFIGKLKVSVTYRRGSDQNDTKTRADVAEDIAKNICRDVAVIALAQSPYPQRQIATLRSTNVYNALDSLDMLRATSYGDDGVEQERVTTILTTTNSARYLSDGRTQAARVEFTGYGGRPTAYRTITNRDILVGMTGYTFAPAQ